VKEKKGLRSWDEQDYGLRSTDYVKDGSFLIFERSTINQEPNSLQFPTNPPLFLLFSFFSLAFSEFSVVEKVFAVIFEQNRVTVLRGDIA
jgi:hypothetical protein